MFRISPLVPRRGVDPLRNRRTAAEWFRTLPALDVIARQERVVEACSSLRHAPVAFDIDRIAAILYLDSALAVDQRRVLKWYLDERGAPAQLGDRFWQVARDVNASFAFVYDTAYRQALAGLGDRRWRIVFPRILARLIHHYGVDAKLRLFRGERPIPAKWAELHRLFLRACEHQCEREAAPVAGEDPLATYAGVEQEYLHVLLVDQLHTGNLTPVELEWATNKLRAWGRKLKLASTPPDVAGFVVDLAGSAGLVRRNARRQGTKPGYLDTTPLVDEIERMLAELRQPGADGKPSSDWQTQWQIAILDKIRPSISPSRDADLRRHPRVIANVPAEVRIGLARITHDLLLVEYAEQAAAASRDAARDDASRTVPEIRVVTAAEKVKAALFSAPPVASPHADAARRAPRKREVPAWAQAEAEEIEIHGVAEDPTPTGGGGMPEAEGMTQPPRLTTWWLQDRSATGWRLSAPEDLAEKLALGSLAAVRPAGSNEWMLGIVSRLCKRRNREVEAGMSMLAARVMPVTLHGRRPVAADMSFEVDGVDASMLGARFDGLYLMPSSRDTANPGARTLVIPKAEHFEGRRIILATVRSNYSVTLGQVIDQRADWSWVMIKIDAKVARAA